MRTRVPALLFLTLATAVGQEPPAGPDMVPSGLRPLIIREQKKSNEVTVVLDPPSAINIADTPAEPAPEPPGLVDDQRPKEPIDDAPVSPAEDTVLLPPPTLPDAPKKQGVIVRVEKIQTASGPVDPADVKLVTPFLAKLPSATPKGWKLETVSTAPSFNREVEISTGSKVTLNIRPHVLIPDTDGSTTFPVNEPGYDSALGYQQTATISAILSNSLRQMEDDSIKMGHAIDSLQQLLISLPKPPAPEPSVEDAPVAKPVR